jgi:isopentenyl-diphosphate delta-isomerase
MSKDELLDLVNEHDEIVGVMERGEVYASGFSNFRVINCFIKNKQGQIWTPVRQSNKRIFPNALDMSCGGHVSSGETYLEAFKKEMMEELNIDIEKVGYKILGKCTPHQDNVSAFMEVYELVSDEAPNYNPKDFQGYEWLYPEEVLKKIENGTASKEDLPKLITKFYLS